VGTLRLLNEFTSQERHEGEVFGCAFTPDGSAVLSAGWDGHLRLWNVANGDAISSLKVCNKPLSSCGLTLDGRTWLSGSMEGLLSVWDGETKENLLTFVAHTRPISSIRYSPTGKQYATSSWDRQVTLRKVGKEREGKVKVLYGHTDIVAGCRYTPDGKQLLSWSYDGTVRLWDTQLGRDVALLGQHDDRVTAAAISPDCSQAVSGSRDGMLKLWNLREHVEVAAARQNAEVCCVFFMLDGQSILTVDTNGWMALLAVPSFEMRMDLQTDLKPMCGEQAPSGEMFVLGCEDGSLHYVAAEGYEHAPLVVSPSRTLDESRTFFDRLMGKTRFTTTFHYTCPICRHEAHATALPNKPIACRFCSRQLRIIPQALVLPQQ
jgi:hypothetical protein